MFRKQNAVQVVGGRAESRSHIFSVFFLFCAVSLYGSLCFLIYLCVEGGLAENMEYSGNGKIEQLFLHPQVKLLKAPLGKCSFEMLMTKKGGWNWETDVSLFFFFFKSVKTLFCFLTFRKISQNIKYTSENISDILQLVIMDTWVIFVLLIPCLLEASSPGFAIDDKTQREVCYF